MLNILMKYKKRESSKEVESSQGRATGFLVTMAAAVLIAILCVADIARGQDISFSVDMMDGKLSMSSYIIGSSDAKVDRYAMKLYAPFVSEAQVSHSFSGMAETELNIKTIPLFANVPTTRYNETIGIMAASDVRCFEEAAGSKFKTSQIEFSSMAGGTETGIGYIADSPYGEGSIQFAYGQREFTRTFSEPEEGDLVVISQTQSQINYNARINGEWTNARFEIQPPEMAPAGLVDDDIYEWQKPWICPFN